MYDNWQKGKKNNKSNNIQIRNGAHSKRDYRWIDCKFTISIIVVQIFTWDENKKVIIGHDTFCAC